MTATVLASSSKANCCLVKTAETSILIDLGLSAKRTAESLRAQGVAPAQIDGILLTHEHGDHVAGIEQWQRTVESPLYLAAGITHLYAGNYFAPGQAFMVGDILIETFPVPHDAVAPVGFILTSKTGRLGYATDLGSLPPDFEEALHKVNTLVIESNYDPVMLDADTRPFATKQRIRSPVGHLSNLECAAVVNRLACNGLKYAVLAHLSQKANTPALARAGYAGCKIPVTCAPPNAPLTMVC